jgi:putative glutamine amidotransferase
MMGEGKADKAPIIGITVSLDHGQLIRKSHEYLYVKRAYAAAVSRAGGNPIMISPDIAPDAVAQLCDGVVISGGDDLPPELYGEQAQPVIYPESAERVEWERRLLDLVAARKRPVLGVCYGMQLINVHFGGSLYQDIPRSIKAALDHGGQGRVTTHGLRISEGSFLYPLFGPETVVSSMHHQAVREVAPGFRVAAVSEDRVVEAIERDCVMAVEWHPEADATGRAIYSLFIERSKKQ